MRCPSSGAGKTRVYDTRPSASQVRRNRTCVTCGARFTTYEVYEVGEDLNGEDAL